MRKLKVDGVIIALMAMLMLVPAAAVARNREHVASATVARPIGAAYATCIYTDQKSKVRAALDYPVAEDVKVFDGINFDVCLTPDYSQMRLPNFVMRGLFFEARYRDSFGRSPVITSFSEARPVAYAAAPASDRSEVAQNYRGLMRIADCVVRADPVGARAVLSTQIGTKREATAIAAVQPTLERCEARRAILPFSAEMIRGTIAEALFRLTVAQAPAARTY